ncbi:MAG: alcohol dehydrogenase catalytic domain-containing protein [Phycisphaerales bacterium]
MLSTRNPTDMRGYWCENSRVVLSDSLAPPEPAGGDLLLRTVLALAEPADERPLGFRGVPGSNFVARVEDAPAPHREWIGRRVAVSPMVTCGACDFCRGGAAGVCESREVMGLEGRAGGLATLVSAPVRNVVELPDRLADEHAVFAWSVAKAARISAAARVGRSHFVSVLGDRPLALLVAQLLTRHCERVRVLGHGVWSASECERLGIRFRPLGDVGRRRDQHVVVDCSSGALAGVGVHLLRPRGTLVLASSPTPAAIDLALLASREGSAIGVAGGNIVEGVSLLAAGALDVSGMIGSREDCPKVLAASVTPATLVQFAQAALPSR